MHKNNRLWGFYSGCSCTMKKREWDQLKISQNVYFFHPQSSKVSALGGAVNRRTTDTDLKTERGQPELEQKQRDLTVRKQRKEEEEGEIPSSSVQLETQILQKQKNHHHHPNGRKMVFTLVNRDEPDALRSGRVLWAFNGQQTEPARHKTCL